MRVRDLIVRLVALRDAGILDEWGSQFVGSLERQAARRQGPTERQRIAAVQLLKKNDPALTARAVAEHVAKLTPEAFERIHGDAMARAGLRVSTLVTVVLLSFARRSASLWPTLAREVVLTGQADEGRLSGASCTTCFLKARLCMR